MHFRVCITFCKVGHSDSVNEPDLCYKKSHLSQQWSFGITVWELFSPGMEPYANVDPFEMAMYLQQGYRISQPANCPDEL